MTNFVLGGKATAQYAGKYKRTETNETKETKMSSEIDASYGFSFNGDKEGGSVSGNLALGRGNNSSISVTNEFSSIMMSIKTVGGNSSFASFSIPKEVKNTNVDLSAWVSSLNDKSTHSIVEFGNAGLIPITDFVVEENLKNQISEYYKTGVSQIEKLQEPYISIDLCYWSGHFFLFGTYLHTRFGDAFSLKRKVVYITDDFKLYLEKEAERASKMFGLKVINNTPYKKARYTASDIFDFDVFNEMYLEKFVYDGTIYLVSSLEFEGTKYAMSIHKDQYIDEYVMRNLINRLPTIDNMTYDELVKNYTVFAL